MSLFKSDHFGHLVKKVSYRFLKDGLYVWQCRELYERGLAPDLTRGGHMGGSAPAIDGPQLLDN